MARRASRKPAAKRRNRHKRVTRAEFITLLGKCRLAGLHCPPQISKLSRKDMCRYAPYIRDRLKQALERRSRR